MLQTNNSNYFNLNFYLYFWWTYWLDHHLASFCLSTPSMNLLREMMLQWLSNKNWTSTRLRFKTFKSQWNTCLFLALIQPWLIFNQSTLEWPFVLQKPLAVTELGILPWIVSDIDYFINIMFRQFTYSLFSNFTLAGSSTISRRCRWFWFDQSHVKIDLSKHKFDIRFPISQNLNQVRVSTADKWLVKTTEFSD